MDERHVGLIIGDDDRLIGVVPVKRDKKPLEKGSEESKPERPDRDAR